MSNRSISTRCFECSGKINADNSYNCNQCSEDICCIKSQAQYCLSEHNEKHRVEQEIVKDSGVD